MVRGVADNQLQRAVKAARSRQVASQMLVLRQKKARAAARSDRESLALGFFALAISIPFGFFSGQIMQSWLAGVILGSSLCAYSILLAQLIRRQPPKFLRHLWRNAGSCQFPYGVNDITALGLDLIGAKDPNDRVDGVVYKRHGEIQRFIRCTLPQNSTENGRAILYELLFADLANISNARFQLVFPAAQNSVREEFIIVVSFKSRRPCSRSDEQPPLEQLNQLVHRLLLRLLTLSIEPSLMNAAEIMCHYSDEFGSQSSRSQLARDWKSVGNLGWEPVFREAVLIPQERCMQVAERKCCTITLEQFQKAESFHWLSSILQDMPSTHASIFVSPVSEPSLMDKQSLQNELRKKTSQEQSQAKASTAQMSFYFRFEGTDAYQVESELATARKYLESMGINSSFNTQKHQQILNWRASIAGAQEPRSGAGPLIAFMHKSEDSKQK